MITLTLVHRDVPLGKQITRLWRCFAEMRAEGSWEKFVVGYVAFLEAKKSQRTHCWHVHLHIIAEGLYFPHNVLKQDWLMATGDSSIVDIQQKGTPEQMARYGAKYASKPINAGDLEDLEDFADAIAGIGRRRLWLIGGAWKGRLRLLAHPPDPGDWEYVDSANAVFGRAAERDAFAVRIIAELYAPAKDARPPPS